MLQEGRQHPPQPGAQLEPRERQLEEPVELPELPELLALLVGLPEPLEAQRELLVLLEAQLVHPWEEHPPQ